VRSATGSSILCQFGAIFLHRCASCDRSGIRFYRASTSVRLLIGFAYDLPTTRVLGGAGWIDSDRWTVDARAAAAATTNDEMRLMVRDLLRDRFQLVAHVETRELPTDDLRSASRNRTRGAGYIAHRARRSSMSAFVVELESLVKRKVTDRTGLTGLWDFDLRFGAENVVRIPAALVSGPRDFPDVFRALPEQLGLELEESKGPVHVVVIESVARPRPD
jgi:hypothetical protein